MRLFAALLRLSSAALVWLSAALCGSLRLSCGSLRLSSGSVWWLCAALGPCVLNPQIPSQSNGLHSSVVAALVVLAALCGPVRRRLCAALRGSVALSGSYAAPVWLLRLRGSGGSSLGSSLRLVWLWRQLSAFSGSPPPPQWHYLTGSPTAECLPLGETSCGGAVWMHPLAHCRTNIPHE